MSTWLISYDKHGWDNAAGSALVEADTLEVAIEKLRRSSVNHKDMFLKSVAVVTWKDSIR
jgi:hypothetical protein